MKLQGLTRASK